MFFVLVDNSFLFWNFASIFSSWAFDKTSGKKRFSDILFFFSTFILFFVDEKSHNIYLNENWPIL